MKPGTRLPWSIVGGCHIDIVGGKPAALLYASTSGCSSATYEEQIAEAQANARYACHAANNLPLLVAAAERLLERLLPVADGPDGVMTCYRVDGAEVARLADAMRTARGE